MTKSSSPSRLDAFFGNPAAAVGMAVVCNVLWGSAFPFIKMGYRLFAIDATDTASIMCFAGVRFMLSALLVYAGGAALRRGPLPMPKGKNLLSCCGLGLWQTAAQYTFYYSAVALLTGAMGGILNSTQSFMGVILAHFLYGKADRMTPRKAIGCAALLVIGLVLGGSLHPQSFGAVPVLLFLAFISGAGYVIWALLMKNNPVSRIAVFGLIIPIMNVLLSAILNGEPLFEWQYLAALVLVCGGIYLVNRPAAGKKKEN